MINLDEQRAARREALKKKPELRFEGQVFHLPIELPIRAIEAMVDFDAAVTTKDAAKIGDSVMALARTFLGDEQYEAFMKLGPSVMDLMAIVEGIPGEYGMSLGESSASDAASKSTGARSRRTSKPPTAKTSAK